MAMYYYARKLQKGAKSSSTTSSRSRSKTPPTRINVNGSVLPTMVTEEPIVLPYVTANGGGNYRFKEKYQHFQNCSHSPNHSHYNEESSHFPHFCCCCGGKKGNGGIYGGSLRRQCHSFMGIQGNSIPLDLEEENGAAGDIGRMEFPLELFPANGAENNENPAGDGLTEEEEDDKEICDITQNFKDCLVEDKLREWETGDEIKEEEISLKYRKDESPDSLEEDLIFDGEDNIVSGSLECFIQRLIPKENYIPEDNFIFTVLLSVRLYVKPGELLGEIFRLVCKREYFVKENIEGVLKSENILERASEVVGESEVSSNVIDFLLHLVRPWMKHFPYDFRDQRMLAFVQGFVEKKGLLKENVTEEIREMLKCLENKLSLLDKYEDFLQRITAEASIGEPIAAPSVVTICPDPSKLAEQLTLVELQKFSAIGPEEFIQTLGKEDISTGIRSCDCTNRKTKNLEAYVLWFQRLSFYVASEICKMSKKKSRIKVIEYWIQVARESLSIRNFNSLMAILAGLNMFPVARLKKSWTKALYGDLAEIAKAVDPQQNYAPYRKLYKAVVSQSSVGKGSCPVTPNSKQTCSKTNINPHLYQLPTDNKSCRIIVPYFSLLMKDIYNVDSEKAFRLKNGHIDYEKCRRLAKIIKEITSWQVVHCDFRKVHSIFNSVQASPIFNEQELLYASYICEQPNSSKEKEQFKKLHKQNIQVPILPGNSSSENDA